MSDHGGSVIAVVDLGLIAGSLAVMAFYRIVDSVRNLLERHRLASWKRAQEAAWEQRKVRAEKASPGCYYWASLDQFFDHTTNHALEGI